MNVAPKMNIDIERLENILGNGCFLFFFPDRVKNSVEQDVFVKHECPCNGHFFENCDLDI